MILRILERTATGLILALVLLFAGDYLSIRVPIPPGRTQLGTLQIRPYYAVKLKNGTTEYMYQEARSETCTHSLFPQLGHSPCWYEAGKPEKQIKLP